MKKILSDALNLLSFKDEKIKESLSTKTKPIPKMSNDDADIIIKYAELIKCSKEAGNIKKSLSNLSELELLSSSNGQFVSFVNEDIVKLNDFKKLLILYSEIIDKAIMSIKTQFEQTDLKLAETLKNVGAVIPTSSGNSSGPKETVQIIGKGESWVSTKNNEQLQEYDNNILNDDSYSVWGRYNKYYDGIIPGTVNCTYYTGKKCEANGFNLNSFYPGNGEDWYNGIQSTDTYTATKYDGSDCLNDLINKKGDPVTNIVVSFPHSYKGGAYGHVLYIDQISEGKIYYSDNFKPGVRKCISMEEFLAIYRNLGNGEPIGCVHLESK